jgi:hypothetical protein
VNMIPRPGRSSLPRRAAVALRPALLSALILASGLALLASCNFDMDYDKHAIVYGISDYPGNDNDLTVADADAQAMNDLLVEQDFQVILRKNDQAILANLADDLVNPTSGDFFDVSSAATLDDLFVFYFSGHGGQTAAGAGGGTEDTPATDNEEEYIALHDVGLTDDQLAGLLRTVPCARKVVILDACFSGGFISNSLEADAIPPEYFQGPSGIFGTLGSAIYLYANFQDYGSDIPPGEALVIAATGEQDVAYETDDNGVMTGYLLESATEADRNFDGYITVSESYFYIYRNINKRFNMLYGTSGFAFFPHVSGGPVDYILFTN